MTDKITKVLAKAKFEKFRASLEVIDHKFALQRSIIN